MICGIAGLFIVLLLFLCCVRQRRRAAALKELTHIDPFGPSPDLDRQKSQFSLNFKVRVRRSAFLAGSYERLRDPVPALPLLSNKVARSRGHAQNQSFGEALPLVPEQAPAPAAIEGAASEDASPPSVAIAEKGSVRGKRWARRSIGETSPPNYEDLFAASESAESSLVVTNDRLRRSMHRISQWWTRRDW